MLRRILSVASFLGFVVCVFAQHDGESPDAVRRARGEPMIAKKDAQGETWVYADGTKIVFRDGAVASAVATASVQSLEDEDQDEERGSSVVVMPPESARAGSSQRSNNGSLRATSTSASTARSSGFSEFPKISAGHKLLIFVMIGVSVITSIWAIVVPFQQGVGWGLGCLFVPFLYLAFLFSHWEEAKASFCCSLLSSIALFVTMRSAFV